MKSMSTAPESAGWPEYTSGDNVKALSMSIDKAAIGLSMACAIHCLLLPVILALLPSLAASVFGDERFHQWLLIIVLPTSLFALGMGCQRHRNLGVLALGLPGLAILAMAVFFGHDLLGDAGEKIASLLGASLIALGHVRNYKLCRDAQCGCDSSRFQYRRQ